MRSFNELKKRWDDHVSRGRYYPRPADTILVHMGETRSSAKALAVEADRERLLTLLGVSHWDQVPLDIVNNIQNASEQWRRGEKVLAHIPLAFTGLPKLESANDAYRFYLAEALLDDGLSARELLTELGLDRTTRQLDKFDPDQPRVPSGSGGESGQWTKDGAGASTSGDEDHKVQLAGDVIYVGRLTGSVIVRSPGGILRTTCFYGSLLGDFEVSRPGIWECKSIERVP